jgi:hypothetical protein
MKTKLFTTVICSLMLLGLGCSSENEPNVSDNGKEQPVNLQEEEPNVPGEEEPDVPNGNILYKKTELGGCNIRQLNLNRGGMEIGNDTIIITISEDSVNVFVGLTFTCKVEPFKTQVEIIDDVLYMHIKDICYDYDGNEVSCGYERCYCYYTFDFVFKYQEEINHEYKILLHKNFRGDEEDPVSIISEGRINSKNR